jgi:phosphatidylglycerophosphate synthase
LFPLNLPNALTLIRILRVPVLLVYAMVVITVASGADYFLNFRRRLEDAARERRAAASAAARQRS